MAFAQLQWLLLRGVSKTDTAHLLPLFLVVASYQVVIAAENNLPVCETVTHHRQFNIDGIGYFFNPNFEIEFKDMQTCVLSNIRRYTEKPAHFRCA